MYNYYNMSEKETKKAILTLLKSFKDFNGVGIRYEDMELVFVVYLNSANENIIQLLNKSFPDINIKMEISGDISVLA